MPLNRRKIDNIIGYLEIIMKSINKEWNNESILEYSKKYTWKNIADKIYKIYESVSLQ